MIKNLGLIPRRADRTRPAFRDYYERRHAPLARRAVHTTRMPAPTAIDAGTE